MVDEEKNRIGMQSGIEVTPCNMSGFRRMRRSLWYCVVVAKMSKLKTIGPTSTIRFDLRQVDENSRDILHEQVTSTYSLLR
jgi:hypothetical protein